MNADKIYELTPEQIALSKARKEKKAAAAALSKASNALIPRPWLTIHPSGKQDSSSHRVKILSWNLLAQCLIRRKLFPTSDCLKAAQREPMIHEEILRQDAHVLCLQEVDRLETLLPMLENAGYSHHYASGPHKYHGCLIAYKKDLFSSVSHKVVYYDDENIAADAEGHVRTGNTFKTRNIANLLALTLRSSDGKEGLIIATTHLFWHPGYTYERTRQMAIMIRETTAFRENLSANQWPCVFAGDFNFSPSDPTYALIFGDALPSSHEEEILASQVIHNSVDPTVLTNAPANVADEDDADAAHPDQAVTNARPAKAEDGLLTIPEMIAWFQSLPRLRSAYKDGIRDARKCGTVIPTYGAQVGLPAGNCGSDEPEYTSYTHYWKAVLDYIFFLDPVDRPANVTGLLAPLTAEDMDPGIPKKRVSGSDHTVLVAELSW